MKPRAKSLWTGLFLSLTVVAGCASDGVRTGPEDPAPLETGPDVPDGPAIADGPDGQAERLGPAPWSAEEGLGAYSNGGQYWVVYIPSDEEIPLNEDFDIEVRVYDGETRSRLVDAEVTVDARMPAHGHGMKLDPTPMQQDDGSYEVEGMLLHMVGHWELYVDLTVGPFTERAQFDIEME